MNSNVFPYSSQKRLHHLTAPDMEKIAPDPVTLFFLVFVFPILDHLITLSCQPLVSSTIDQFITAAATLEPHSLDSAD